MQQPCPAASPCPRHARGRVCKVPGQCWLLHGHGRQQEDGSPGAPHAGQGSRALSHVLHTCVQRCGDRIVQRAADTRALHARVHQQRCTIQRGGVQSCCSPGCWVHPRVLVGAPRRRPRGGVTCHRCHSAPTQPAATERGQNNNEGRGGRLAGGPFLRSHTAAPTGTTCTPCRDLEHSSPCTTSPRCWDPRGSSQPARCHGAVTSSWSPQQDPLQ